LTTREGTSVFEDSAACSPLRDVPFLEAWLWTSGLIAMAAGEMSMSLVSPAAKNALIDALHGSQAGLIDLLCEANGVGATIADGTYRRQDLTQFFGGLLSVLRARLEQAPDVADDIEDDFFSAVLEGVLAQGTSYREVAAGSNATYLTLTVALLERVMPEHRRDALGFMTTVTSGWLSRVLETCIAHARRA
jgi:hypothetical protein